jgi:HEAT repeat protein
VKKLLLVCAAVAAAASPALAAPSYEGKPASFWIAGLDHPDPSVRLVAATVLGEVNPGSREVVAALRDTLRNDENAGVRGMAALSLGTIGPRARAAAPALADAVVNDSDADVRQACALTLGALGPCPEVQNACPALARALVDKNEKVANTAADALRANARVAVPRFIDDLGSSDADDRLLAVAGLGVIGPDARAAAPALRDVANDPLEDPGIRRLARRALAEVRRDD